MNGESSLPFSVWCVLLKDYCKLSEKTAGQLHFPLQDDYKTRFYLTFQL